MSESSNGAILGVDHVGYVVTDLDQAVSFFIDVLGFRDMDRRALLEDPEGDRMTRRFGVDRAAQARYVFLGIGEDNVELLEWRSPDQRSEVAKNSDRAGRHLALKAANIGAVAARLSLEPGVTVREPNERGFIYVTTPFGLELQLIPA